MEHLGVHFLMRLAEWSIPKKARKTARGIEGRMGGVILLLPLFAALVLLLAGVSSQRDPVALRAMDPWVAYVAGAGFFAMSLHLMTYRLRLEQEGTRLSSGSWLSRGKVIDLSQPFAVGYDEEARRMQVWQQQTRLVITWKLAGHQDFFDAIWARSPGLTSGEKSER